MHLKKVLINRTIVQIKSLANRTNTFTRDLKVETRNCLEDQTWGAPVDGRVFLYFLGGAGVGLPRRPGEGERAGASLITRRAEHAGAIK